MEFPARPLVCASALAAWLLVAGAVAVEQEPPTWPQLLERREFAALTAAVAAADERRRAGELDSAARLRRCRTLSAQPASAT